MDAKEEIRARMKGTLAEALGMELLEAGPDAVVARMPVDARTKQPAGLLHGGASVALAETLASMGGMLRVAEQGQSVVGLEINANHVRAVSEGFVIGTAKPIHVGRSSQVWEIRICDERDRLVSISRCTLHVLQRRASDQKS